MKKTRPVFNVFMAFVLALTMMPGGGIRAFADEAAPAEPVVVQDNEAPSDEAVDATATADEAVPAAEEEPAAAETEAGEQENAPAEPIEGEGEPAADAAAPAEPQEPEASAEPAAENAPAEAPAAETQAAQDATTPEASDAANEEKSSASASKDAASKDAASKDAAAKEDEKSEDDMKATAEDRRIQIDFKDRNGNLLNDSALGNGVTLYYYEIPADAFKDANPSDSTAYVNVYKKYEKTLVQTSASEKWTLNMEEGASADNPFTVIFTGGSTIEALPSGVTPMPMPFQFSPSKWVANFSLTYDGESATVQGSSMTVDSDGVMHGTVYLDDTLVQPKTSITFDASAFNADLEEGEPSAYPVYARVSFTGKTVMPQSNDTFIAMPHTQVAVVPVSADGTVNVQFPDSTSRISTSSGPMPISYEILGVTLYSDSACTQQLNDWKQKTSYAAGSSPFGQFTFTVQTQEDGTLKFYDPDAGEASEFAPAFEKIDSTIKLQPIILKTDSNNPAVDYPLYVKVRLVGQGDDSNDDLASVVVTATANGEQAINLPKVDTSGYYGFAIVAELYNDAGCTQPDTRWHNGFYWEVNIADDGTLVDAYEPDTVVDTIDLQHYYTQIQPFDVETFSSDPDTDYPVYVKVKLAAENDEGSVTLVDKTVKCTANDTQSIDMPMVDESVLFNMQLTYGVYSDEACTQPLADWEGAGSKDVFITAEGTIGESDYDPGAEPTIVTGVAFTHVFTKQITLPMTADFGTRNAADFFPVTAEVTLSGDAGFAPVTVTRTFTSANELALGQFATFEFNAQGDDVFPAAASGYTVTWKFYTDANKTTVDNRWSSGSRECGLNRNCKLTRGSNVFGLNFRPLSVEVAPQAYEEQLTVNAANPIYVKVAAKSSDTGATHTWTGKRENTDQFTAEFAQMSFAFADVNEGETWNVYAQVTDSTYAQAAENWVSDPTDISTPVVAKQTLNDGLQTVTDNVTATMNQWGGTSYIHAYTYEGVVLMPEYVQGRVAVTLPIHVNIPDTVDEPFLYRLVKTGYSYQTNWDEALHLRLYRQGTDGLYHYWDDDRNASYGYSYHWVAMNELDDQAKATYDMGYLAPGTYYLGWYMGAATQYSDSTYKRDPQWIAQDEPIKITVTEDGKILDASGKPYVVEVYMKDDYKNGLVNPLIDVEFTPHEDYAYSGNSNYINKDNPYRVEYTLTPLWSGAEPEFTYGSSFYFRDFHSWPGRSYISTYYDWYQYNYNGDRTVPRTLGWMESNRLSYGGYLSSKKDVYVGWPVGDYELSYGVVDDYITNPYYEQAVQGYSRYWYKDTVKVHLGEDGKIYKIKDDGTYETDPYVIEVRYLSEEEQKPNREFDYLTVKVNTRINEGITEEQAFSDDETFRVTLCTYRWREGTYTLNNDIIGYGDAKISETGETTVKIYGPDGGSVKLPDDTVYELYYGTYTDTAEINGHSYPVYSNRWVADFRDWPLIDENGALYLNQHNYADNTDTKVELVIDNYSLLAPWQTVDPKEVVQGEEGPIFKPVTDFQQFQDKGHYIVVVQNQFDNSWYALAADENGGYQVKLEDVHSLDDLKAGYQFDEANGDGSYILTANKVKQGEESVQLQFKTGAKDDAGKALSLKMGTSSTELRPLFSSSAGTVIIKNMSAVDAQAPTFQVWKGSYAVLNYVHEIFGQSGFGTIGYSNGGGYYSYYPAVGRMDDYFIISQDYMYMYGPGYYSYDTQYGFVGQKPSMDASVYPDTYGLMSDEYYLYLPGDEYYTTDEYKQIYETYLNSVNGESGYYLPVGGGQYSSSAPDSINYYILTDVEEPEPAVENNTYTLVKTFGDFYNTFINQGGSSSSMLLVYTDDEGNEYALNPKGAVQVQSKPASNGYNKIVAGAENEFIPDNNSGTSSTFGYELVDVVGTGEQVFANPYALRKGRLNNAENMNYVTLNGAVGDSAWTKSDDPEHGDGLVYVMQPTKRVMSQADWDTAETYKMRVVRYGETGWLGLEKDENGKQQMVIVADESAALEFSVYAPVMTRYYSSAYGSDFYRYFKINSLEEINAGDELLIVYNDGEKRYLVSYSIGETSGSASAEYGWNSPFDYPALEILDAYSTINIQDDELPDNVRYQYRLDTDGQEKKPYAYFDSENEDLIWAQGVAGNAVGTAKKESKTQRKYESVTALGNQLMHMYLKTEKYPLYHREKGEVNFFNGDEAGTFVLRGGKSDAYLATKYYNKSALNLVTGRYEMIEPVLSFDTVSINSGGTAAQFEIYKKANTDDMIRIEYYDTEKELDKAVVKPAENLTLPQEEDLTVNDVKYVFVGWTADPAKSGLLGLEDSANLFDYEDLSKLASVKPEVLEKYDLLGDCNPDADNIVPYDTIEPLVKDGVLKLYPVYAVRGFSSYVTGDEGDIHVIGITDFKDLQMGGDGNPEARERWLGAINIEIYKDGALWVSETHGEPDMSGQSEMSATAEGTTATMYFAYHNDNAADLNIKFIEDVVDEELGSYLSNDDFSAFEPTEKYVIDAVYAEQGGSEDGLKYRYNWMDKEHGGQLDNVKGGSTVKVYVTTKYQVKYYFDAEGDGVYYELPNVPDGLNTDEDYTNPNFYTTVGTERAVNELKAAADYVVMADNEYKDLMNETSSLNTTFKDDQITRGEYQYFLYKFDEYPHVIPIMHLPEPPAGYALDGDAWTLYPKEGAAGVELRAQAEDITIAPSSDLTVTDTTYGTGNSGWSYKDAVALGDTTNTYHLYIAVQSVRFTKVWDDSDDADGMRPTPGEFASMVTLYANGEKVDYKPTIIDNDDGTFTISYPDAPMADEQGNAIEYMLEEGEVPGYAPVDDVVAVHAGETLTNFHEPETVDLTIKKVWADADDQDGKRPSSVEVSVLANGEEVEAVQLVADDEWTFTLEGMLKNEAGREISYTLMEQAVSDYSASYDGLTVTNTYTPGQTSVSVTKIWEDNDDEDGVRPESVTIHLFANGVDTGKTLVLDASSNWQGSFTELDEYAAGEKIVYTVTEDEVESYSTGIAGDATAGFVIVNLHISDSDELEPQSPEDPTPDNPTPPAPEPQSPDTPASDEPTPTKPDKVIPPTSKPAVPKTGDGIPVTALSFTAGVSALLAALAIASLRRREEDEA